MLICKADTKYHTKIALTIFKNTLKDNKKHKKTDWLTNKTIIHHIIILKHTLEMFHIVMMSSSAYIRHMNIVILWIAI